MANHTTGSQRYNKRMDAIFERAKSEGRGLVGNSHTDGVGVNSPAMKAARKAHSSPKSAALNDAIKKVPKHYRGNTNSEGGIPFGKKPK